MRDPAEGRAGAGSCSSRAGTVRRMSSLNLDDFTDLIERPDGGVRRDAEARRERLAVPPGSLGRLDDLGEWLAAAQSAVPVRPVERPR
ncbi:nicotinate-nucleotide--dimethylbenzimidazole phosphoribosyltransferase, partial [Streptomyces sp. SID9913]|uniref:nicotinate-nucleotide--dimethylbenzimidazole phosphoribosyltransferase n=1 Tax=Streptomyces sp. SID9913 TaxID=2706117 RepID=UPI001EF1995A